MRLFINLTGGFGNQIFCYAFGYALSRRKNADLILDTTAQDNGVDREMKLLDLNVSYAERISYVYQSGIFDRAVANKIRRRKLIGFHTDFYAEKQPTVYDPDVLNVSKDTYFKGFWQSEKYFKDYRNELLELLTMKQQPGQSVINLAQEMRNCCSVGVHIRRGDYVSIGCQLDMRYYDQAIALMKDLLPGQHIIFYVFSDDLKYCKEYFSKAVYSSDGNTELRFPEYDSEDHSLHDMYLMSQCHHMIMANSSFSWWGSWLNQDSDQIVICPELGIWKGDFYPDSWKKIKCESFQK